MTLRGADTEDLDSLGADISRQLLSSWAHISLAELATVPDDVVTRIAERLVRLPEGYADSDAPATRNVLRDFLSDLYDRASRDVLTGLRTRGAIQQRLSTEVARASRYGRELGVLLVDVDGLKGINDAHGHLAGDALLTHLSVRLQANLRSSDQAGRWGGDEFLVLCPEADRTATAAVAAKLVRECAGSGVVWKEAVLPTTVSIGWVSTRGRNDESHLLSLADAALYRAKAEGRARAVGYLARQHDDAPSAMI